MTDQKPGALREALTEAVAEMERIALWIDGDMEKQLLEAAAKARRALAAAEREPGALREALTGLLRHFTHDELSHVSDRDSAHCSKCRAVRAARKALAPAPGAARPDPEER